MSVVMIAYGLGLLGVVWFALDSARIPSVVWFWSGYSRPGWWLTMVACLVALGIPAFVAAIAWRASSARRTLFQEVAELRGGRITRSARAAASTRSIA